MQEALIHLNANGNQRLFPLSSGTFKQRSISYQTGMTIHPQSLLHTWNHKEQSHSRSLENIAQRIEPPIPRSLRNHQYLLIQNQHEARSIATRRDIASPRSVDRANQEKRGSCNKVLTVIIQMGQLLADD